MTSEVRAATVDERGGEWIVDFIELDERLDSDEVLLDVLAAGLCHSDEHLRVGDLPSKLPFVGGHEGSGVVRAVGSEVSHVSAGDRVTFCFRPSCGTCSACQSGQSQLCVRAEDLRSDRVLNHFRKGTTRLAATNLIGSFATRTVVPGYSVIAVPAGVSDEAAAILGCAVITGYGAVVRSARAQPDDVVLVVGAGGVGIAAIQSARAIGADVIAVDPSPAKQQLAEKFGACASGDTIEHAVAMAENAGVTAPTVAVLSAGVPGLAESAARVLRPGGRVVLAALGDPSRLCFSMPINELVVRNLTVTGSILGGAQVRDDVPAVIALSQSGAFDIEGMITGRYSLDEIREGYTDLHRAEETVRNVVMMNR